MTEVPTKWEYLKQRCINDELPAGADIADEIDNLIKALGYGRTTPSWDGDFSSGCVDRRGKIDITFSSRYCVPCTVEDECEECLFCKCGGARLFDSFAKIIREDEYND